MSARWFVVVIMAFGALLPLPWAPFDPAGTGAAWAGDDGGDDDGDDDDDRDGDDGSRAVRRSTRRAPDATPTRAAALAASVADELVVLDLAEDDLAALLAEGFVLREDRTLPALGQNLRRLGTPPGVTQAAALDRVRALPSGAGADLNHFYRAEADPPCNGPHCPQQARIAWPGPALRSSACIGAALPVLGMLDTGINPDHDAFAGARLEVGQLGGAPGDPSRAIHGTAVAALLVGQPDSRSPGLLPEARLVAVDIFHRAGRDERADVFALIAGLDRLAEAGAEIVNLSLAGPPNALLAAAVAQLDAAGVVLVAAAGNAGPQAPPQFPAAYPQVIAVTAVDRSGAPYRRAVRGPHIDLAAPGVEVWTAASVRGGRPRTGTSFAAPFVTAAAALLRAAEPGLPREVLVDRLRDRAADLGAPGPDPVFGAGLLSLTGVCPGGG